jgi:small subunit ribosomal protein S20
LTPWRGLHPKEIDTVPNIKSAKKRNRQARKSRVRNRHQRSELRSAIKQVRAAQTPDEADAAMRNAERFLDRAAQKGLIHENAAGRVKSRLRKALPANA